MSPVEAIIRKIKTPTQAQEWLRTLAYNKADTMYGLQGVLKRKKAHCLEGVLSVAALLEPHGYPPLILDLESKDNLDHTLFLYKENGKFGTVAMSRDVGLDGRKPVFKTIRALVQSYVIPYIDAKAEITGYGVLDLRTLADQSWRTSTKQLWYIEDALLEMPHSPIHTKKSTIKKWREKYLAYKKSFPDLQPDYFPHQETWL